MKMKDAKLPAAELREPLRGRLKQTCAIDTLLAPKAEPPCSFCQ